MFTGSEHECKVLTGFGLDGFYRLGDLHHADKSALIVDDRNRYQGVLLDQLGNLFAVGIRTHHGNVVLHDLLETRVGSCEHEFTERHHTDEAVLVINDVDISEVRPQFIVEPSECLDGFSRRQPGRK